MKKAIIFVANGTEESEAIVTADILKRAGVEVTLAAVSDTAQIKSSNGFVFQADTTIDQIDDFDKFDVIVLPGGMPGVDNIFANEKVRQAILDFELAGKDIAAICAAPKILGQLGIIDNKQVCVHPHYKDCIGDATISVSDPITYDNITTSGGLGHVISFALQIVRVLCGDEAVSSVAEHINYPMY